MAVCCHTTIQYATDRITTVALGVVPRLTVQPISSERGMLVMLENCPNPQAASIVLCHGASDMVLRELERVRNAQCPMMIIDPR